MVFQMDVYTILLLIGLLQCQFLTFESYLLSKNQPLFATNQILRKAPTKVYMAGVPVVPYYPNKGSKDYMWMDIYNALGRTRTLFVGRYLDEENCNQLIASLIWLQGYVNNNL